MDIRDKVVIITGASSGIGLATARLFAKQGAKVALAARSVDKLEQLANELPGSLAVPVDMRDPAAVVRMVDTVKQHYGRVDVLINNAGRGLYAPLEKIDLKQYHEIMELNVFGPLVAMQAVIPIMRSEGGGVIINVSSSVSKMFLPGLAAYASTKYALNALSLTARAELAADHISVGVIYPRRTATNFATNVLGPGRGPQGTPPSTNVVTEVDSPAVVAERILEAVQTGRPEQYISAEHERQLKSAA